ncbi:hypothetical protein K0P33_07590 [Pseudomonas sp. ArH3a]|uniref:hypothetical protein n=1 Tax=Pseudomonas TaxID=286 RepID=UPI000BA10128|nr:MULTISPECIES: hypothetical protein [unclassified Pseudomonas]MCV2229713.1 hypothetical protein [Pseudomonas sp. AU10]OZO05111.1 hypothetical protein B7453_07265 [Pseudomonas sp. IB20]UNM21309.1 hypothetical protein K0P33_07590 [Pseudomonas sp. ArH3a]
MSIGFQVFNADRSVLLDQNFKTYGFVSKTTQVSTATSSNPAWGQFLDVWIADAEEIVAVRAQNEAHSVCLANVSRSGSGYIQRYVTDGSTIVNLDVYRFRPGVSAGGTFGMQIFNEHGELAYDATTPQLIVRDVLVGSGNFEAVVGDHNYDPGRKYAVVFGGRCGRSWRTTQFTGGGGNYRINEYASTNYASQSPGKVSFKVKIYYFNGYTKQHEVKQFNYRAEAYSYLIVDVSGI